MITEEQLNEWQKLSGAASPGPWKSMRNGNQYLNTTYLPTARVVATSVVQGLPRPWNPHRLLAFGLSAKDYETSRFLDEDADFISMAREAIPQMIEEIRLLRGKIK